MFKSLVNTHPIFSNFCKKKRFQKLLPLKKILRQLLTPHTSIAVNTGKDNPGHSQAPSNLVKAIVK